MGHTPPGPPGRKFKRICRVKGCPEEGQVIYSEVPPLDTRDPRSHYSQHHAAPGDVSPALASGVLRPPPESA